MSNLCPSCFTDNPDNQVNCRSCGTPLLISENQLEPNHLSPGSLLKQQYKVEKTLGQGGFAITYQATNLKDNSFVAIKELWPDRAGREGSKVQWPHSITPDERKEQIQKFQDEAQKLQDLAKSRHPSIVKVYDFFLENETVYIVMEFINGKTLHKILKEEGILPETRIKKYFLQLAYALKVIHQNNLLHRDIKPENIIINHQDRAVLIDFGAAREFLAGRSKNMTRIWTPGYAPPEQYSYRATRHPNADIYSLCAAMYELVTDKLPADALDRVNSKTSTPANQDCLIPPKQLAPHLSLLMEKIILTGMKLNVEERFKDADHLIAALNGNFMSPLFIKARQLVKEGKLSAAAHAYERCLIEEPDNGKAAVERALVLTHLNDPKAETAAHQAMQLQPDDGRAYGILGLINCRQSNWKVAVNHLQEGVKLAANESWIWANLGWALAKTGNWQQALFVVDKALELDQNSTFAWGLKAWIAGNQEQWHIAISTAQQAISNAQKFNSPDARSLQTWTYPCLLIALHKVNSSELEKCWQLYVNQVPDSAFAYGFKAWMYASQNQWTNALAELQKVTSQPTVPFWIYLNLGIVYEHLTDYQSAIKVYQNCHNTNEKNTFVLFRIGTLLGRDAQSSGQQDLWSKASLFLEIAVQLQPDYAEAYHNLGWVLHHIRNSQGLIDNYPRIREAYRQAIKLYEQQNKPVLAQGIKQAFQALGLQIL